MTYSLYLNTVLGTWPIIIYLLFQLKTDMPVSVSNIKFQTAYGTESITKQPEAIPYENQTYVPTQYATPRHPTHLWHKTRGPRHSPSRRVLTPCWMEQPGVEIQLGSVVCPRHAPYCRYFANYEHIHNPVLLSLEVRPFKNTSHAWPKQAAGMSPSRFSESA